MEASERHPPEKTSPGLVLLFVLGALGLLSVPLVILAIPRLIDARGQGGESRSIGLLKTLNSAQSLFREGDKELDGTLDYGTLVELWQTGLVDAELGRGAKAGYVFTCAPSPLTPEFLWFATASPGPDSPGERYFATNHAGVIYYSTLRPFTTDPECALPGKGSPPDARPVGK